MNSCEPSSNEPTGAPRPFDRAKHHRIEFARNLRDALPQRHRRVENPRAIEMHAQSCRVGALANIFGHRGGVHRAAVHVVRIFERQQRGLRIVVNFFADQRLDQFPRQNSAGRRNRARHHSRDGGHGSQLVQIYVRALLADYFVAALVQPMMASRLPMQPVGTKSAASRWKISAARDCSRFTVGSSPYTSSPTSAAAIARAHRGRGARHRVAAQIHDIALLRAAPRAAVHARLLIPAIPRILHSIPSNAPAPGATFAPSISSNP